MSFSPTDMKALGRRFESGNRTEQKCMHTMNRLRFTAQLFPPPTSILCHCWRKTKDDFRRTECKCSLFLHRKISKAFSFYSTLRMREKAGEGISNNFLRFEFEFEWSVNEHACSLSLHLALIIIDTKKLTYQISLIPFSLSLIKPIMRECPNDATSIRPEHF